MAERASRLVFVSPHPDDAIWSCGGRLAELANSGCAVDVVTCFDGDPVSDMESSSAPDAAWRGAALCGQRRDEDRLAASRLGIRLISLGLSEAALRRSGNGWRYGNLRAVFGEPAGADDGIVDILRQHLAPLLAGATEVHVPMGMASHVDHRLVRLAVDRIIPGEAWLYDEFPYRRERAVPEYAPVGYGIDLSRWLEAALLYRSQIDRLFGGPAAFRRRLSGWIDTVASADRRSLQAGAWRPTSAR